MCIVCNMKNDQCPLCISKSAQFYTKDKRRDYFQCQKCFLIFADKSSWPTPSQELETYDQHENSPSDHRYRDFLSKMYNPISEMIALKSQGLDFGCGSGPTLSVMFEESGHKVNLYDKYYFDDVSVFNLKYDFITATEVFEHLFTPRLELEKLLNSLKDGGVLGIMTKFSPSNDRFNSWYYKEDPTHICFYSKETFQWIANCYNLNLRLIGDDVAILSRDEIRS